MVRHKLAKLQPCSAAVLKPAKRPPWDTNTRCDQLSTLRTDPPRQASRPAAVVQWHKAESTRCTTAPAQSQQCAATAPADQNCSLLHGSAWQKGTPAPQAQPLSAIDRAVQRRDAILRLQRKSDASGTKHAQHGMKHSAHVSAEQQPELPAHPASAGQVGHHGADGTCTRKQSLDRLAERRAQQRRQQQDAQLDVQREALEAFRSARCKQHVQDAAARVIQVGLRLVLLMTPTASVGSFVMFTMACCAQKLQAYDTRLALRIGRKTIAACWSVVLRALNTTVVAPFQTGNCLCRLQCPCGRCGIVVSKGLKPHVHSRELSRIVSGAACNTGAALPLSRHPCVNGCQCSLLRVICTLQAASKVRYTCVQQGYAMWRGCH